LVLACVLWHTSVAIPTKVGITPWLCAAKNGFFILFCIGFIPKIGITCIFCQGVILLLCWATPNKGYG
jgi:hypothetical protein